MSSTADDLISRLPREAAAVLDLPCYVFRVGVHTLGQQVVDEKSENHVTLSLLLGGNACLRVDMKPGTRSWAGNLDIRLHPYTLSSSIIKYVDIPARNCPNEFDPQRRGPRSTNVRLVRDLMPLFARLQHFLFMNVDGKALGCRYWV